ncbi:helix-turn-helix domain-containing protein [Laceyella putida]|uniref:Helix-turn-helix domain-containing protein n=1 Tax=Laceyella putida TaxID=110101 RepID=A0ABW2RNA1_9BACL
MEMNEKQMKAIIGGIFGTGTYTEWTEDGEAVVKKEKFNIRLYKDLWESGAIKRLKGNKLHVFLTIAIHANNQGEGWPTQRRIASMLGINKDTVTKALESLEKDGFIERDMGRHDEKGRFDSTVYKIRFAPDPSQWKKSQENTSPKNPDRESQEPSPKKSDREESNKINQSEKIGQANQSEKTSTGKTGTGKTGDGNFGHKEEPYAKDDPLSKVEPLHKDDPSSFVVGVVVKELNIYKATATAFFGNRVEEIDEDDWNMLIQLANQKGKDLEECMLNVRTYFKKKKKPIDDLVGALVHEIRKGWKLGVSVQVDEDNEVEAPKEFTPAAAGYYNL